MALTPSTMTPLGSKASEFNLLDTVSGEQRSLTQLRGAKGTLVMFICNHCPYVIHINAGLARLGKDYQGSEISIIAISANDSISHPQDGPAAMHDNARMQNYGFPYLFDDSQNVAKAYGAACTPDFFLYDENLLLVYRGQFDDARPGNDTPVDGADLRRAMESLLSGSAIDAAQKASIGCNIKWRTAR